MFGSSKPVVLSYGSRRARKRVPPWLLWLLSGVAVGAGGLWWLQEQRKVQTSKHAQTVLRKVDCAPLGQRAGKAPALGCAKLYHATKMLSNLC